MIIEKKRRIKMNNGKIGRNEKCPCESNKKYKKCHGSDSLIDIEKASKGTLISENEANKLKWDGYRGYIKR
jgi:hypothetical protein